ncbi:hypothetical protein [Pseudoxanthomonas putridarboris]|uniref:Uncharacterized protein n=1 Tax=Pseudoxanthomonas putridarboris TaxID=752605 RepID=A0ABU9IWB1_9GAMM
MCRWLDLGLLSILTLTGSDAAYARETRELCLDEKIESSEAIFIGRAVLLEEPSPHLAGVSQYAAVKVENVLKGNVADEVRFVVRGFSSELNPPCCETDKVYLFFAKHGYELLELSGTEISSTIQDQDRFLSGTNGPFSTFQIHDDIVAGWNVGNTCGSTSASVADVQTCIRSKVSAGR